MGYDHKYTYSHFGYNLKATDMQAAIGVAQLKKLPSFIDRRKENWTYLRQQLIERGLEKFVILPEPAKNSSPSWFGFLMTVRGDCKKSRNEITAYLENHNIQTRLLFSGNLIKHPCFDEYRGTDAYRVVGDLNNTDNVMEKSFWVGVYPGMTDKILDYIADCLEKAFK